MRLVLHLSTAASLHANVLPVIQAVKNRVLRARPAPTRPLPALTLVLLVRLALHRPTPVSPQPVQLAASALTPQRALLRAVNAPRQRLLPRGLPRAPRVVVPKCRMRIKAPALTPPPRVVKQAVFPTLTPPVPARSAMLDPSRPRAPLPARHALLPRVRTPIKVRAFVLPSPVARPKAVIAPVRNAVAVTRSVVPHALSILAPRAVRNSRSKE